MLLVAVDDAAARKLEASLGARGLGARRAGDRRAASSELHIRAIEVVIVPAAHAAFTELCENDSEVPVIALLDDDDEQRTREALRTGAVGTLGPAWPESELDVVLERALGGRGQGSSGEEPPPASRARYLLGDSEPMRRVSDLIERAAGAPATTLVRGETGTGKELVARALHAKSSRKQGPFVKVHCAALPDALLESELFGYEKGAFTGATARKPGRVELAEGGTLFLDEIGDVTPAVQIKLLRLLQDREYERLGGVQTIRANVRFVAATHRDLEGMVKRGAFREDLFYRLNVVAIWLPPLRARRDDVPALVHRFCTDFCAEYGKRLRLEDGAIAALRSERWPGNVRQLQNFVERLVVLSTGSSITAEDVRREMAAQVEFKTQVTAAASRSAAGAAGAAGGTEASPPSTDRAVPLDDAIRKAEKEAIERALRQTANNRTLAARILGVSRATLYTKLTEHGIA